MVDFRPARRVADLPPHFFESMDHRITEMRAAGAEVIDLSRGNPDLPTPPAIVAAMQRAVAAPRHHRYPAVRPTPDLARAVQAAYRRDHGVEIDADAHVGVFHGSHEALMAAVLALTDPGETVLLPDPGYPIYGAAVALAGGTARYVPLDSTRGHRPDFSDLDAEKSASASVLLLNYPNNPTGALATPDVFHETLDVSERLGALFLHDFAYASLGFDGRRPLSALSADPDLERTVEASTLSKTYNMAGWRIGYAVGNASAIRAMRDYQSSAFSTVFGATQDAAAAAIAGDQTAADDLVRIYQHRRDVVVAELRRLGWEVAAPEGTFFVWFATGGDDIAFAERLLEEHGVAVAPGSAFGPRGAGHARIGLVHDEETLMAAMTRFSSAD